jgi:hypothetical protein
VRVPKPTRTAVAALAAGVGIAIGSGGLSLMLWGGPPPAAVVIPGSLPSPPRMPGPVDRPPEAAAPPVRIDMPSIHVSTTLVGLHVQDDGTLEVPSDPAAAGWWSDGTAPGDPGPAVVIGHVDSLTGPAAFYRLSELRPGDKILIGRADRTSVGFVVDATRQYPKNAVPRDLVYGATPTPTLRLLTCGGAFNRAAGHYTDNLVVFAHLAEPPAPAAAAGPTKAPPASAAGPSTTPTPIHVAARAR